MRTLCFHAMSWLLHKHFSTYWVLLTFIVQTFYLKCISGKAGIAIQFI